MASTPVGRSARGMGNRYTVTPSMALIIQDRSWPSLARRTFADVVPPTIRAFVRGPLGRIDLSVADPEVPNMRWPLVINLPEHLILKHNMRLPRAGRKELRGAIELFVAHSTPFEPKEVIAHAFELPPLQGADGQISYELLILPRAQIEEVLKDLNIPMRRLRFATVSGVGYALDLAKAVVTYHIPDWCSWGTPVLGLAAALALILASDLSDRQNMVADIQQRLATVSTTARELSAKEAKSHLATDTYAVLKTLIEQAPSSFLRLQALRKSLPSMAAVQRIDLRGQELRVLVRSSDVLAVGRALADRSGWANSIEGAVTTDPASHLEVGTILLKGLPK